MAQSFPFFSPSFAALRVLVLEDNDFERKALVAMLRRLGVSLIDEAVNGDAALGLIDQYGQNVDLVLCDLQMRHAQHIDGVEFLRMAAGRLDCPLVLVSGIDEDLAIAAETLAAAKGASWGGRLRKPVLPAELCDVLQACAARNVVERVARTGRPTNNRPWSKADLRMALNRRELLAYFQPQYCLATGKLFGVEALARWEHPQAGVISPTEFIPLMEHEGMVDELFDVIFDHSLDFVADWAARGVRMPVSVNASPLTLENIDVPNLWRARVKARGLEPDLITIEVTETAVARNFHGLLESVTRLRMHDFRVALDDFGTSFSSLQQMSELPATEVKIDRSFLDRAMRYPRARLIFESMVRLGRNLGLSVVAEGVETYDQAAFALGAGCDAGQGWLYARPVPCEEFQPGLVTCVTNAALSIPTNLSQHHV